VSKFIDKIMVSESGDHVAIRLEGQQVFQVLRFVDDPDDAGNWTSFMDRATPDGLGAIGSGKWAPFSVTKRILAGAAKQVLGLDYAPMPVEPRIEPLTPPDHKIGMGEPAVAAESPLAPDTVTLPLSEGPQVWYLDREGADRLDEGLLLATGPGSFGARVASPRRIALVGALLGLARKRLTAKSQELDSSS
jgi:hypothetical protein